MEESLEVRIGRYLSGEMTRDEMGALELEMSSNLGLKAQFEVFQGIWQHNPADQTEVWDTESAWNRFSSATISRDRPILKLSRTRVYLSFAATFIVLLGVFAVLYLPGRTVTYTYSDIGQEPIELPDGSKVYLNKSSSISVHPFTRKNRRVDLTGEAFFQVTPDGTRPFLVESNETITEVVGTSFNIRPENNKTYLFVESGKVIFSSLGNKKEAVALTKGEAAFFDSQRMQQIPNPSLNMNAWHTHQLHFGKMTIAEIVADLSAYFGQEIIVENKDILNCKISNTLSYKNPEISPVLNAIATAIKANIVVEGVKYIIRGGSCN